MGTPTPKEQRAYDALGSAAASADAAERASGTVGKKAAQGLRQLAAEAKDVAATKDKAVRKHPKRVARAAAAIAAEVSRAVEKALRKHAKREAGASQAAAIKAAPVVPAITDGSQARAPIALPAAEDLGALTVAALRARARAEGRYGYSRMTKAQLVELLA